MAKYMVEITEDKIVKTLNFMGKDFVEEWEEGGRLCHCSIERQVEKTFPDLGDYEMDIIENLYTMDEHELVEAMDELSEYERSEWLIFE